MNQTHSEYMSIQRESADLDHVSVSWTELLSKNDVQSIPGQYDPITILHQEYRLCNYNILAIGPYLWGLATEQDMRV